MSFTTAQLASEINSDPTGLGYAQHVASGDDAGIAAILNTVGTTKVFRNDIAVHEVINAIVAADFAALTQVQLSKLTLFFTATNVIDATNANTRTIFLAIFTGMAGTITALTALAQRNGMRAEVLWGVGTVITAGNVSFALRGT
jgi:hypothetical protein